MRCTGRANGKGGFSCGLRKMNSLTERQDYKRKKTSLPSVQADRRDKRFDRLGKGDVFDEIMVENNG